MDFVTAPFCVDETSFLLYSLGEEPVFSLKSFPEVADLVESCFGGDGAYGVVGRLEAPCGFGRGGIR